MKILLFGEVAVEREGQRVGGGTPAQKKLLALLALRAGHRYPIDQIVEDMWPDEQPANTHRMVRMYVSRLRSLLGPDAHGTRAYDVLVTEPGGYRLDIDERNVDIKEFEHLVRAGEASDDPRRFREALSLWRDDPLTDFPYDDFAIRVQERLRLRRFDALEGYLTTVMRFDVSTSAIDQLTELVEQDPWREGFWRLLVTGLARSGRTTEALRVFDRYSRQLIEVGLEPGADLSTIAGAIARGDEDIPWALPGGNLPTHLDQFVGRRSELRELEKLITDNRLVSLVGVAGGGKTRLAQRGLRDIEAVTWFIDLTGVVELEKVAESIIETMGLERPLLADPIRVIESAVGHRDHVLLFDSCEDITDAVGSIATRLLQSCPNLRIVATSREPLRARGEVVMHVSPLPLPTSERVEDIATSDAGQLLRARAVAASSAFEITSDNAASVASVLQHSDGIPLAIELLAGELVAAPFEHRSEEDITAPSDPGAAPATSTHQQALALSIDRSYNRLSEDEQSLFRALSVVADGFDVADVNGLGSIGPVLRSLVSKSMVSHMSQDRFRLLNPLAEYAASSAARHGETGTLTSARDSHYTLVARELAAQPDGFHDDAALQRFLAYRARIVNVLNLLEVANPEEFVTLVRRLASYWAAAGLFSEETQLLARATRHVTEPADLIELRTQAVHVALRGGNPKRGVQIARDALAAVGESDAGPQIAQMHNSLGSVLAVQGRLREARTSLESAVRLYSVHRTDEWYVPILNLAAVEGWAGNAATLRAHTTNIRERMTDSGHAPSAIRPLLDTLDGLGARVDGDLRSARDHLAKAQSAVDLGVSTFHRSWMAIEHAVADMEAGHLAAAERHVNAAAGASESESALNEQRGQLVRAWVAYLGGEPGRTREILGALLPAVIESDSAGRLAEIADLAALVASDEGEDVTAAELIAASDQVRSEHDVGRDAWETDRIDLLRSEPASLAPQQSTGLPIAQRIAQALRTISG